MAVRLIEQSLTALLVVGAVSAAFAVAGRIGWVDMASVLVASVVGVVVVEAVKERTGYTTITVLRNEEDHQL